MAKRLRGEGALLASAMQLGICEATLEHATEYALRREQYNRPIGSFQAIKHFLADMLVRKEQATAAVYAAAATADVRGVDELECVIAVAKLIAREAAHKNARQCIQICGGMGYVWEMAPAPLPEARTRPRDRFRQHERTCRPGRGRLAKRAAS